MDSFNRSGQSPAEGKCNRTLVDGNSWWQSMDTWQYLAAILVLLLIVLSGVFINAAVLVTFYRHRLSRSPTNLLLLNLTVSNLLLAGVGGGLLAWAVGMGEHWPHTTHCGLYVSVWLALGSVSVNTRTAIAMERYLTISRHWNGSGQRYFAVKCIGVSWLVAGLWGSLPWLMAATCQPWTSMGPVCIPSPPSLTFSLAFLLLYLLVPVVVKAIVYWRVYSAVTEASCRIRYSRNSLMNLALRVSQASQCSSISRKSSTLSNSSIMTNISTQVARHSQHSAGPLAGLPAQERRLALAMAAMVALALLTWAPYAAAVLWHSLHPAHHHLLLLWACVATKTCAIHNPLVYVVCNRRFRATFLNGLACQCLPLSSTSIAPLPVHMAAQGAKSSRVTRPSFRWRPSFPLLATINETGSHVALPGSKQNDYDSGYALSPSPGSRAQTPQGHPVVGSVHCRTTPSSSIRSGEAGFSCIQEVIQGQGTRSPQHQHKKKHTTNYCAMENDIHYLPPVQN